MKKIICIFSLILFLSLPVTVYSKSQPKTIVMVDAKRQLELARTLFAEKDFIAAANEYLRFSHLFKGSDKVEQAEYKAGLAYFYAGLYSEAQKHLEKTADHFSDSGFAAEAMFKLSELYTITNRPGMAVVTLKNLIVLTKNTQVHDTACFMLGWLLMDKAEILKAHSDYRIYPLNEAEKYFSMISRKGKQKYKIEKIFTALSKEQFVKKKSPVMAGIFSIIPGGGFLYCGRYRDAFVSFLLNTSLIFAAHKSFKDDNAALGGVIAFVEAGFYSGNIYGAISSAHKFNKNKREEFIRKLKEEYQKRVTRDRAQQNKLSLKPALIKKGLALTLKYNF